MPYIFRKKNALFLAVVIIPTILSILYFGIFASDVYISESRFVVKAPKQAASDGVGLLLQSAGFNNANEEVYATNDYIISRSALQQLNRDGAVTAAYTAPGISIFDRFNPLGWDGSFEKLFKYYTNRVEVTSDSRSAISTLVVRAYSSDDALRLNSRLLQLAEDMVNRLNTRGREDLIKYAQAEVDAAKQQARTASLALAAYRNKQGVVDPQQQAAIQLQMVSKLQDELITVKSQLIQLRAFTPENPQIPVLEKRARILSEEIYEQTGRVAGDNRSLAAAAVEYQRLQLENSFAERQLAGAMASLQEARNEARRKQVYVERIVNPNRPDSALEPQRLRGIIATFVVGLIAWGILSLLLAGVREHQS
ncbi:WcbD protein [Sphingobium herbicidovorans NBRC 16415]|uniref:WcbD protein n=1 Tax=Sphingobium herbicidovorans (strain ATCC 700291 / DSM 11019 / CCUG 56400 / KCTC 2939 / LMG 18315 / NBRC 16415 / MH) TaxID=1219045 RepID=A0A086PEC5_SPHHM|nr:WcbD protein [Sphingobium herbicidovorans NBRC 16415]